MTDYDLLVEQASAGADIETFKNSNAGRYLYQKAEVDELAALRKLAKADPGDKETIHRLQLEATAPRLAIQWIEEGIRIGKLAKFTLDEAKAE